MYQCGGKVGKIGKNVGVTKEKRRRRKPSPGTQCEG